jgi:hypothetical protein
MPASYANTSSANILCQLMPTYANLCKLMPTRMMNNALWIPERAVELQLRLCGRHTAALQDTERTKRRLAQSRSMWHGQRSPRMSRSLCRTVCTVLLLFLETKCHDRCVCSYMHPSPSKSCISTSFKLGCQETGSISTCYFSRMI